MAYGTAPLPTGTFCSRLGLWDVTPLEDGVTGAPGAPGAPLDGNSLMLLVFVIASSAENDASFWYRMSSPSSVKPSCCIAFEAFRSGT